VVRAPLYRTDSPVRNGSVVDPIPIIGRGYNVVANARSVANVSARC
jgi:hypothetical protein